MTCAVAVCLLASRELPLRPKTVDYSTFECPKTSPKISQVIMIDK